MIKDISVVLLGAGKSKRFDTNTLKQNVKIHDKRVIDYSVDFFRKHFNVSKKYFVINKKIQLKALTENEHILYGSTSRLKSLNNCLNYISRNNLQTKYLLVHDVARPILNLADIKKIIREIHKKVDGSTLGYPLTNAVKEVKNNTIYYNIHKSNLWSTFTPQIFKTEKLYKSVKACLDENYDVDDDIEALLLNSLKCSMIMSSPTNIKVTYKSDINYIKKLL